MTTQESTVEPTSFLHVATITAKDRLMQAHGVQHKFALPNNQWLAERGAAVFYPRHRLPTRLKIIWWSISGLAE